MPLSCLHCFSCQSHAVSLTPTTPAGIPPKRPGLHTGCVVLHRTRASKFFLPATTRGYREFDSHGRQIQTYLVRDIKVLAQRDCIWRQARVARQPQHRYRRRVIRHMPLVRPRPILDLHILTAIRDPPDSRDPRRLLASLAAKQRRKLVAPVHRRAVREEGRRESFAYIDVIPCGRASSSPLAVLTPPPVVLVPLLEEWSNKDLWKLDSRHARKNKTRTKRGPDARHS